MHRFIVSIESFFWVTGMVALSKCLLMPRLKMLKSCHFPGSSLLISALDAELLAQLGCSL